MHPILSSVSFYIKPNNRLTVSLWVNAASVNSHELHGLNSLKHNHNYIFQKLFEVTKPTRGLFCFSFFYIL